ncbi:hypothetical protein LY76DRAFT_22125 [Colletotrichum caudatum]|nr:hypothetical protein LY76DRAFT_22125 [Colletotrichum caudatum]
MTSSCLILIPPTYSHSYSQSRFSGDGSQHDMKTPSCCTQASSNLSPCLNHPPPRCIPEIKAWTSPSSPSIMVGFKLWVGSPANLLDCTTGQFCPCHINTAPSDWSPPARPTRKKHSRPSRIVAHSRVDSSSSMRITSLAGISRCLRTRLHRGFCWQVRCWIEQVSNPTTGSRMCPPDLTRDVRRVQTAHAPFAFAAASQTRKPGPSWARDAAHRASQAPVLLLVVRGS